MKKRTWYLTLLTIITVICIAIGLLVHVVLPAGNWLSDMSDDLDDVNDSESFLSGSTVYEEVAAFSNIHLEMEVLASLMATPMRFLIRPTKKICCHSMR